MPCETEQPADAAAGEMSKPLETQASEVKDIKTSTTVVKKPSSLAGKVPSTSAKAPSTIEKKPSS